MSEEGATGHASPKYAPLVVTHTGVDLDAACAAALVRVLLPEYREAKLLFISADHNGEGLPPDALIVDVDAGGHGLKGTLDADGTRHSATRLVVERFATAEQAAKLAQLVITVDMVDTGQRMRAQGAPGYVLWLQHMMYAMIDGEPLGPTRDTRAVELMQLLAAALLNPPQHIIPYETLLNLLGKLTHGNPNGRATAGVYNTLCAGNNLRFEDAAGTPVDVLSSARALQLMCSSVATHAEALLGLLVNGMEARQNRMDWANRTAQQVPRVQAQVGGSTATVAVLPNPQHGLELQQALWRQGVDAVVIADETGNGYSSGHRLNACLNSRLSDRGLKLDGALLQALIPADEQEEWFFHPSGFMLARGTLKTDGYSASSRVTPEALARAVAQTVAQQLAAGT